MVAMTLYCAIVGMKGIAFPMRIDPSFSVSNLTGNIREQNSVLRTFDLVDLRLFLAKTVNGQWLPFEHNAALELNEGKIHADIKTMINEGKIFPTKSVDFWLKTNDMPQPSAEQIHVLVVLPEDASGTEVTQRRKLTSLGKLLKYSKVSGELPQTGDFLRMFELTNADCGTILNTKEINDIVGFVGPEFYILKEILCVLENFKKTYQQEFATGEMMDKQLILMGNPGTGKSSILALISF